MIKKDSMKKDKRRSSPFFFVVKSPIVDGTKSLVLLSPSVECKQQSERYHEELFHNVDQNLFKPQALDVRFEIAADVKRFSKVGN